MWRRKFSSNVKIKITALPTTKKLLPVLDLLKPGRVGPTLPAKTHGTFWHFTLKTIMVMLDLHLVNSILWILCQPNLLIYHICTQYTVQCIHIPSIAMLTPLSKLGRPWSRWELMSPTLCKCSQYHASNTTLYLTLWFSHNGFGPETQLVMLFMI